MLDIDGSMGGGQILRTALSLATITGEPIRITDIRGGRSTPGLRPQHLTAVRLLTDISGATVSDVEVESTELEFEPGEPSGGTYEVTIGTAGSLTLLFDAVLPVSTVVDRPLRVTAQGGTDVKWSPPFEFFRSVKLPLLRSLGLQAAVDLDRWGFYPAGGGSATLGIAPSALDPIDLADRGALRGARVYSKCSLSLADRDVADRQSAAVTEQLRAADVSVIERVLSNAVSDSPGSAVVIRLDATDAVAGFDSLGERGKPAEDVGEEAAGKALQFIDGPGAVDRYLGDQLVVFLALAGGTVTVPSVTDHIANSLDLVEAFDLAVDIVDDGPAPTLVRT